MSHPSITAVGDVGASASDLFSYDVSAVAVIAEENECDVLACDRDLDAILRSGAVKARPLAVESR